MVAVANCQGKAALRRKPKVYNALITTDEDLVQSRAYPVIQPTIHESGIAHYGPLGPFSPYGVYNPHVVRLAQPIAPALTPKEQVGFPNILNLYTLPNSTFYFCVATISLATGTNSSSTNASTFNASTFNWLSFTTKSSNSSCC